MESEILVSIQFRLSQAEALDRRHLAEHLSALMKEAVAAGGDKVTISLQPYDPEEEVD